MEASTREERGERRIALAEILCLAAVVIAAVFLRLHRLGDAPFGRDAAEMLSLADRLRSGERILTGISTSKGMLNPPLSIYLLAALRTVLPGVRPLIASMALWNVLAVVTTWWVARRRWGAAIGLAAAGTFAVSTWAVLYARSLWQQDFLPPFGAFELGAILAWAVDRRPWMLALALAIAAAGSQLHYTALAWFAILAIVLVRFRPPLRLAPVVAGCAAGLLLYAPFLVALFTTGIGSAGKAFFADFTGSALWALAGSTTHAGALADFTRSADLLGNLTAALRLSFAVVPWVAAALVVCGVVAAWRDRLESPASEVLLIWVGVPVLGMLVLGLHAYPHYLIATFPAGWIFLALGLRWLVPDRPARFAGVAAGIALAEGAFLLGLQRWIAAERARPGAYGTSLADFEAAAAFIVTRAGGARVELTSAPELEGGPDFGDGVLTLRWMVADLQRARGLRTAGTARFLTVDESDGLLSDAARRFLRERDARSFGPLWASALE